MSGLILAAFAAGMVSTVNPCGFAMLPAYLGFILADRGTGRSSALVVGAAVSVGFVAVFVIFGVLIASGLRAVVGWIPWMALVVGVGLAVAGVAILRGFHLFARLPGVKATRSRSFRGLVGFGASFGVASLSCTLPIFLSLVAATVATGSLLNATLVFTAYGLGMSLVVIVLTLVVATGRDRVVARIRPLAARLNTVSGWVMIAAGVFIAWYWATVLTVGAGDLGASPIVRLVDGLTATVANLIAARPAAIGVGALVIGWVLWAFSRRSGLETSEDQSTEEQATGPRRG